MISKSFNLTQFNCLVVLLFLLTGCSSGGSDSGSGGNSGSGLGSEIGIVNGFHVVRSTSFDEFDNVVSTRTYDVDFDRRIMDVTTNDEADPEFGLPAETRTSIAFFDEFGRLERWTSDIGTTQYEFNEQGRLSRYSDDFFGEEVSTFDYDASGRLMTRTRTFSAEGTTTETRDYSYNYDAQGFLSNGTIISVIEPVLGATSSTETTTMSYAVDSSGRITRRERIYTSDLPNVGPFTDTDDYEYDANGNVISNTTTIDGEIWLRRVFEYEPSSQPLYNRFLRIFRYFP